MTVTKDRPGGKLGIRKHRLPKHLRHFEIGKTLVRKDRAQEAWDHFQESIRFNPKIAVDILICLYKRLTISYDNQDLRSMIVKVQIGQGHYKPAIMELEEAFDVDPNYLPTYSLLGKIYKKTGQKLKIRDIFESAAAQDIFDQTIVDTLPQIYLSDHSIDKSIDFYKKLINSQPNQHKHYKNLSALFSRKRDYESAAATLEKLLTLTPHSATELHHILVTLTQQAPRCLKAREILIKVCLAICEPLEATQQIEQLLRYHPDQRDKMAPILKKALDQYPDTFEILILLGNTLRHMKQYSECTQVLRQAVDLRPDQADVIIKLLNDILAEMPDQIMAISLLGDIFFKQSDIDRGLHYYDRLIDINQDELTRLEETIKPIIEAGSPSTPLATYLLAKIRYYNQDYPETLSLCDELESTDQRLSAHLLQSKVHLATDKFQESYNVLHSELQDNPYHWDIHAALRTTLSEKTANALSQSTDPIQIGKHLLTSGEELKAMAQLQKASGDPSKSIAEKMLLSRSLLEMGRYDLAINQLQKLLASSATLSNTDRWTIHKLIAFNFSHLGKLSESVRHLELIFEEDIHFQDVSGLLEKLKQLSHLELRGHALFGCMSQLDGSPQTTSFVIENQENQEFLKKKRPMTTMSFSQTQNNQGVLHFLQHNKNAAADEFQLATQMDPQFTISYYNLAYLHIANQDYEAAKTALSIAQDCNRNMDLLPMLHGLLSASQGHYEAAITHFKKALKRSPNPEAILLNLGDAYFHNHQLSEAFSCWKRASAAPQFFHLIQRRTRYLNPSGHDWTHDFSTQLDPLSIYNKVCPSNSR